MSTSTIIIMITIIAYMAIMLVIGITFSKKNSSVGDFYLGGRKLGPIVTAMSAEASDMSSWLLMGLPGVAYLTGGAEAGWTAIGLAIGTYLNWLIVAKRLRIYSSSCNAITIPDFFSNRYRDGKKALMGISALIILIFFVPYTASGFSACGKLFSTLFNWDYHAAMIISAVIIIAYTCSGGFLAASFTDLIQSIVMTLALISIVCFGIHTAGGFGEVVDNAKNISGYFSLTHIHNLETGGSDKYSLLTIASLLAWGLGYFGMPHILLRFMAIGDKNKVKTSRRIASVWVVISMAVAIFIGFIGNKLTQLGKLEALDGNNSETIIIKIAQFMSEKHVVLAIVAGLVFAGILACTMSTSDSQLLAASSSMSENILKGVFNIKISEKQSMLAARAVLVVIAALGVVLAWNQDSSVFRIVSFAWAGFGATFGPVVLTALFWKRSNKYGAIAGMIAGAIMVFVWKFGISKIGGAFAIYELLPAFVFALAVIVIVSLLTPAPEKEIVQEFENVQAEMKK
ncbi:MAG: sodium/proline symporter [Ruminococcus flavefaciens]|nr:sodium/proline symporter [Ruminococcus flavefaciens]MCM1362171.1 sodium/proline symporter [Clostridiales bacterium]MCM1435445.1 sodium/proline symporter [Ruminococcus flavefaciens]